MQKQNRKYLGGIIVLVVLTLVVAFASNGRFLTGKLVSIRQSGSIVLSPNAPTAQNCARWSKWNSMGTLTANMRTLGINLADYPSPGWNLIHSCENNFPGAWYGYSSARGCEQLGRWMREGTFTSNWGPTPSYSVIAVCQDQFPSAWFGYGTWESCRQLRDWMSSGNLSSNLPPSRTACSTGSTANCHDWNEVYGCADGTGPGGSISQNIWNTYANAERCALLNEAASQNGGSIPPSWQEYTEWRECQARAAFASEAP